MRTRNCDGGEKTTYSQTKRHEQKERLSSNKCMAAHSLYNKRKQYALATQQRSISKKRLQIHDPTPNHPFPLQQKRGRLRVSVLDPAAFTAP